MSVVAVDVVVAAAVVVVPYKPVAADLVIDSNQ